MNEQIEAAKKMLLDALTGAAVGQKESERRAIVEAVDALIRARFDELIE